VQHCDVLAAVYSYFRGYFLWSQEKLTANEHDADGEDLLGICIGAHVAKTDAGEATEGEVERGDVGARDGGATHGAVDVRGLQTLSQLMKPSWWKRADDGCVRLMWSASVEDPFYFVGGAMGDIIK